MIDFDKLRTDLEEVRKIAEEAADAEGGHDGGTCNSDSAELYWLKRAPSPKDREQALEALTAAGLHGYWSAARRRRAPFRLIFSAPVTGQGARRTRAAQAIVNHLRARGWDAMVFYVTD